MPIDLRTPMVFAHRGFSFIAPENTIPAFKKAFELGADGIELDVQLSADGEVMVIHDTNLERTSNGVGKVSDHTLSSLKKLDAGSWFSKEYKGVSIPTLGEVFSLISKNIVINVELKSNPDQVIDLPAKVTSLIKELGNQERVLISSFKIEMIKEIQQLLPEVKIGLLAQPSILGFKTRNQIAKTLPHDALHPFFRDVSSRMIKRYNKTGKRIHAYTVNKEEHMRKLFEMGVHGIFTDHPDIAMRIRAEVEV
jgi:glycerophosphoryl diester phosphodiesterase